MTKNTSTKKVAKTIEEAEALGLTEIEIEVSDEVYNKLNEFRCAGESDSDVIRRMIGMVTAPAVARKLESAPQGS